jgi:hypothetical protein
MGTPISTSYPAARTIYPPQSSVNIFLHTFFFDDHLPSLQTILIVTGENIAISLMDPCDLDLSSIAFAGRWQRLNSLLKNSRFVSGYRFSDTASRLKSDAPLGAGIGIRFFQQFDFFGKL